MNDITRPSVGMEVENLQFQERSPSNLSLVGLLAGVVSMWVLLGWFAMVQQHTDAGTFGDMFGAANALFSAMAFATLIYTILLQRAELRLQRMELKETRKELQGQRVQLEQQNELMRADAFENSFFRVLTMLGDIVASIDLQGGRETRGRDCFGVFYKRLEASFVELQGKHPGSDDSELMELAYSKFYERHQGDVGHYFRTLYNLVKLVDRSNVEDKHFYTNLVRAQLSNQEMLLLFYNCSSELGKHKFKPLVEEYALLKNMPKGRVMSTRHLEWFNRSAYGKEAFKVEAVAEEF